MALVPPPHTPEGAGTAEGWADVEQALGTALPQDYKGLIDTYGAGWFADWICVFSPFSTRLPLVRPEWWRLMADHGGFPEYHHPFPMFPAQNGLLPWGEDDNRHPFCWLTEREPDSWTVINLDGHYSEAYRQIPTSVTGLLAGWLAGELIGDWYSEDVFPTQRRIFRQGNPQYPGG